MSKSISFRLRFTLLIERDPLKHRRDVLLRMANEILVLIQDIVDEKSSLFLVDRSSASRL